MKKYFVFAFVLIFISISLFAENDPKVPITRIENSTGIAPFSQVRIRHEEPVTFLRQETAYGNNVTADNWYSLDTGTMVATTIAPVTYACFSGDYGIQGFFAIDYNTDNLLQIDPDTGAETIIGYMPCPLAASGGIWSDLCCDKTTGNWYAIAVDLIVNSQIYSVDITNASITWVADLISTGTISGAVDQNGLLYTLCIVTDSTYETDLSTYTTTLLGPAGFDANYAQGAAYEPIDDIFYFAAYSTSAELRSLNRVSGATTYVGALPGETGAFGFPGSIAPAEAPAAPTDVVVTPDAGGALVADIDWVCPTEQVNGDPLTELLEMRVYRDDVLIYTDSSPTIGGPGSYADVFVPLAGQYTYKVVGYNSAGEGLPAIVTVWVGEDVPNAVTDLTLTDVSTDDLMAQLDWVNPTTGLHGGYFPGVTGYDIERSDGATFTIGGPVTLWIDDTIVDPGIYWYAVTPFNNSGSGPSTQTPSVGIGISVIEVGNAEITDYQIPMNIWYQNNITECVYDKEWIGTGMIINAIAFHAANITSTINPFNFEIWFGEIDIDDLSGGWIDASQLTMVFDGTIDVPTGEYWLEIPLDTPFIYENNDNLVMGIIKDDDEYYSTSDVWYTTQSGTANRTLHEYSDSQEFSIQSPPGSSNPKTTYPDIRLYYSGIADPLAPGEPTDVTFIPDAGGDPECDISWTCPSLNYGGDPLAELLEMRVYRDGALVYTDTNPTIGGPGSYTDVVPASGYYEYEVLGYNSYGEGPGVSGEPVWVGEDVPSAVEDLLLEQTAPGVLSATLTWVNPTTGLHGGPFNEPILGYHIVRLPDNVTFELAGIATEYIDDTIPLAGNYFYTVQPYNSIGDGGIETSNTVLILDPGLLIFEGFEDGVIPVGWTQEYVVNNVSWIVQTGGHSGNPPNAYEGTYNALLYESGYNGSTTKLITPELNMGTGDGQLAFWHCQINWAWDQDFLYIYYKNSPTGDWVLLESYNFEVPVWTEHIVTLTGTSSTYYVAFEGFLDYGWGVCIDEVMITSGSPPLAPPTNLYVDESTGLFTWDPPDLPPCSREGDKTKAIEATSRDLIGYNVYLDDMVEPIGSTTFTEWQYVDLVYLQEYIAGVSAVYDDPPGESAVVEFPFTCQFTGAGNDIPLITELSGNFPNPFNPDTEIKFSIKDPGHVTLNVFNIRGQLVKTLVDEKLEPKHYSVIWDGKDNSGKSVSSGIYFYKMCLHPDLSGKAGGRYTSTKKMILMK